MRIGSWIVLLVLAAASLGSGCKSSTQPQEILPFPIQLRATTPGDSVTVVDLPLAFSATFNQEVAVEDVIPRMIPMAREMGSPSVHGRTFDLSGVMPASTSLAHWMILDGPRFLHPYVVHFFTGNTRGNFYFPDPEVQPCLVTGDVGQVGMIIGQIFSNRSSAPSLQYTLVFAYRRDLLGPDPGLEEVLAATPQAVSLAETPALQPAVILYAVENLVIDVEYTLLAIVDTSGDGLYRIEDDWWGYAHDVATGALSFASAHIDQCTPILNVEMRPPTESSLGP